MKTKTILSIAIMAALPFGAHADPVGPAAVPANGTAVVATANAPYVTQTPTAADATHIASTAYVKGAYNDAIAAVNKVANTVDGKQAQLVDEGNHAMYNTVMSNVSTGFGRELIDANDDEYEQIREHIAQQLTDADTGNPDETLISTGAVLNIVREVGRHLLDDEIPVVQGSVNTVQTALNNKRVEIYTTWENDNAKQQVALVTAQ